MHKLSTYKISIEYDDRISFKGELVDKDKAQERFDEIKDQNAKLQKQIEEKENNLNKAQDDLKQAKKLYEDMRKQKEQEYNELKNQLEDIKDQNAKLQKQVEEKENNLNKAQDDLKQASEFLTKINKETYYSLYISSLRDQDKLDEYYKKPLKSYYEFVKKIDKAELEGLHFIIKTKLKNDDENVQYYIEFFNSLFEILSAHNESLKRFETKEGEEFDIEKCVKIRGANSGKVTKVLFQGFKSKDKKYESLVEVG
ncbi:hypothetical protein BXA08_04170 [Campylobacter lari]|nr:hypothetical protein [Campylobacter lari]